ncbi:MULTISPECIES: hypothetical protein [Leptospira]|uniref:hypothetical protein n=1 Tax=Leptospira TaxID=171 RepID=UPI000990F895|nr:MULTISPECIES: hypothetical protein [Leptospira]MDL5247623.1 hypothetical protein [Leptospira weilii]
MLATKSVTVRIDNDTLDRFERLAQKAQKSAFGTFSTDSIQDFLRRLLKNELDRLENKVATGSK